MPEGFVVIVASVGEIEHTIECLRELDDSEAGVPTRPLDILTAALDGPSFTYEQVSKVTRLVDELAGF